MRRIMVGLVAVASIATACSGGGEQTSPGASPSPAGPQAVQVKAQDYFFEGVPETLEAGPITFEFENEGLVRHEMSFGRLIGDKSIEEVVQLPESQLAGEIERMEAGIRPIAPGESRILTLDLEPGRYAYVCFVAEGTGAPHAFEGMVGEFTVA